MKLQLFIPFIVIIAVSCGPFPHQVMQEVTRDIPYNEVVKAPETFRGSIVLWGGVIVETITRSNDTLIIVRETQLDFRKRPRNTDKSAGRFIIRHQGFLDPAIYSREREVTVVGMLTGKEERSVGELLYSYPVIEPRSLKLWEQWTDSHPTGTIPGTGILSLIHGYHARGPTGVGNAWPQGLHFARRVRKVRTSAFLMR